MDESLCRLVRYVRRLPARQRHRLPRFEADVRYLTQALPETPLSVSHTDTIVLHYLDGELAGATVVDPRIH